jgi:hypothetical protein
VVEVEVVHSSPKEMHRFVLQEAAEVLDMSIILQLTHTLVVSQRNWAPALEQAKHLSKWAENQQVMQAVVVALLETEIMDQVQLMERAEFHFWTAAQGKLKELMEILHTADLEVEVQDMEVAAMQRTVVDIQVEVQAEIELMVSIHKVEVGVLTLRETFLMNHHLQYPDVILVFHQIQARMETDLQFLTLKELAQVIRTKKKFSVFIIC